MTFVRSYIIELSLAAALLAAVAFFSYLGYGLVNPQSGIEEFSGERALADAARQMEFGPRVAGTRRSAAMGDWLVDELSSLGWSVLIQPYALPLAPELAGTDAVTTTLAGGAPAVMARNIIAVRSGAEGESDEERPVALLVTHYDSRIAADANPDPERQTQPVPGANSGASGVAVLLELARTLNVTASGHTLCLVFLDGEDNRGVAGWQQPFGGDYFLQGLATDQIPRCRNPRFAVTVDLAGNADQRIRIEDSSDPALSSAIWQAAADQTFEQSIVGEASAAVDGFHQTLIAAGIPTSVLADFGYAYRYTTADTIDKLSAASFERVGRTLEFWLEQGAPFGAVPSP